MTEQALFMKSLLIAFKSKLLDIYNTVCLFYAIFCLGDVSSDAFDFRLQKRDKR